jgi:hypothetical protein
MREALAATLRHPDLCITVIKFGEVLLTTSQGPAWGLRIDGRSVSRYYASAGAAGRNQGLSRDNLGERPPRRPPVPHGDHDEIRSAIDPADIFLTATALSMYSDRHKLKDLDDESLHAQIRANFATDLVEGDLEPQDGGSHRVSTGTCRWIVSDDCQILIAYKPN